MITVDFASVSWRKSTYSGGEGGECVELADLDAAVGIRDSKNPYGPKLVVSRRNLRVFITRIKSGHHEIG